MNLKDTADSTLQTFWTKNGICLEEKLMETKVSWNNKFKSMNKSILMI